MLIPFDVIGVVKDFHFQTCMWPSSLFLHQVTEKDGFEYLMCYQSREIPASSSAAQAAGKNMIRTSLSNILSE